ncbi:hypothetical protein [Sphingosinicella terrae]|uniref:hypothetical protein n=1 Tax=Sphingosinicella terrae TaxID=2172047 RepID=UPI000E0D58B4|nr:hypothetical protein [Sphingosinicella terrae]
MKSWPKRALLLVCAASAALAIPALSQESEAPESLLPPGFGDPEDLPPPVENQGSVPSPSPSRPTGQVVPSPAQQIAESEADEEDLENLDPLSRPRPTNFFSVPEGEARPVDRVGLLGPESRGVAADAFGRSNGPFLATLMGRLDAPLPSRWTSILLRRALMSRLDSPSAMQPVDWVAARADLLLRMGEADAARMLVQAVDQENYTPRMIEAAARAALATADPAGLCPLIGPAGSSETVWKLADAMCAALEGEPTRASALMDEARRRGNVSGIDYQLAEKVIGAGAEARRAASLEWEPVGGLTPWRIGLASATGTAIPDRLIAGASPAMQAWFARAPMVPVEQRLAAASTAAALGVFSTASLVEAHSLILDQTDPAEAGGTIGARLRTAWTHGDPGERLEAMRSLWREAEAPRDRYARLILTAGAATRIPASADHAGDAADLIASMLAAGHDRAAARWSGVVQESGDLRAWALLALGAPGVADLSAAQVEAYVEADDSPGRQRSQLLIAGLAGLGRLDAGDAARLAAGAGFRLDAGGTWSGAIDEAAAARAPATVALLAAVGMQTAEWRGVPAANLFRIVRALGAVGLDYEARMIAAEAVARL